MRPSTLCLLLAMAGFLPGCADLRYYVRAARGQAELRERARPIEEVLADPRSPEWLRQKLRSVNEIREFARRELRLPDDGSFRSYADLGRPYAVWNVFAAPELSTRPKEWCFPVAGCVTYRGYFSAEAARDFADGLSREEYDVHIAGVPAYSTLGWFDDPVLNTFVRYPERDLARLVFHELAHRIVYVKDDSTFNESFATAVELEGARRWLSAGGRAGEEAELEASEARDRGFRGLVTSWRGRLEALYAGEGNPREKRERKRLALEELRLAYADLRAAWGGYGGYDAWFAGELNNAKLASVATYTALVPAFRALLQRYDGDVAAFYDAVRELGRLSRDERRNRLQSLVWVLAEGGAAAGEKVR